MAVEKESVEKDGVEFVETTHNSPITESDAHTLNTMWQSAKENPKVLLNAIMMTLGPMAFGFDIVIVGVVTAIPAFLTLRQIYILPSLWLSLWNAFMQIGFMLGSVINGPVADRFGRRISMMIGATIVCIGVAVVFTSDRTGNITHRRGAFLAGKVVLGIGLSMILSTCQTYNSEIAPTKLRAPLLSVFQFFLTFGMLIAAVVAKSQISIGFELQSYRVCFATQWAFAGAAFIGALIVPESPAYFLRRGDVEGARRSFIRLHDAITADDRIVTMQATLDHERQVQALSQGSTYWECFKGTNWRRTRIIIYASILQQFLGVSFVSNGTYFLILAGMSPGNSVMVLEIVSGLSMLSNMISWVLASTIGRRRSLIIGTIGVGVLWVSAGISGCFKSHAALWYTGIVINTVMVVYNVAAGGIAPVVISETSSIRLRAKSNSLGFLCSGFMSWAFNFFIPYMFNADQANWGGKTSFFFAGLSLVAAVVIYLEVPEMNKRTYMQIDEMFENEVRTRDFVKWQPVTETSSDS